ncbi:MAG: hypothetical protein AB7G28_21585 [Pirellulales bacterium]
MKLKSPVVFLLIFAFCSSGFAEDACLRREFANSLRELVDKLIELQDLTAGSPDYGALYCKACDDHHTRASEAVLPFAVAYRETGDKKYLVSAMATGEWLIDQQKPDGSWFETPSEWTGTTTDQLLMMAAAYPLLKDRLDAAQQAKWLSSIKQAGDWLVKNMNHEFASINYCATTTATLMVTNQVVPDPKYVAKAKELAMLVTSKFDDDYFLTGEGNRVRGTKYGVDLGYSMDMSIWGLGLYAKLAHDEPVDDYVRESLKRYVYFIWPDGSTDGSWGVRSSKWTTFGSFTADGCQILFSLYADEVPMYRTAALANLKYLMSMREDGLITYGPNYKEMFDDPPCIYPTFCRAKNLALAILYGDQSTGSTPELPTQKTGWSKHFKTMDLALVRTKNFMATVTGYQYKDIRRGADFKYMHRPSGGSITNLWVKDYGYLQASGQTEYFRWEMNYPEAPNSLTITPRIEFADSEAYYTNLYEFDSHLDLSEQNGAFVVEARGELKDRNRWEGGVAYVLTHTIDDRSIEKHIKLRFHGPKPVVTIVEPFIQHKNTRFEKIDDKTVEIRGGSREFVVKLLSEGYAFEMGKDAKRYRQPFPALKGYPISIRVTPDEDSFLKDVAYRISIKE